MPDTVAPALGPVRLTVGAVVSERRQEFATMAALGASLRDVGAFVRAETTEDHAQEGPVHGPAHENCQ